ncbi:Zinc/iron permease [Amylostereum chailletii]|nr:Zinc/iron permease [Amylostereum chailletii]
MSPVIKSYYSSWDSQDHVFIDAAEDETTVSLRVGVMAVIFGISLIASSFPSLSRHVQWLAIPRVVFFIGKHFGTGVILSTAFVHLLQDAFESLQDPRVKERTQVGKWTGLIVLSSLLLIFLVEYTSTSYVDRLHSYPSNPSTPKTKALDISDQEDPSEITPLLPPPPVHRPSTTTSLPNPAPPRSAPPHSRSYFEGHHRHESRESHLQHGREQHPRRGRLEPSSVGVEDRRHSEDCQNGDGHAHHENEHDHGHMHLDLEGSEEEELVHSHSHPQHVEIGRKRQVVGILVLQLGIMLHSLVIGLTLSISSGADFTSLVIAIVFHQMFEGLSLGIRIAGLPAPPSNNNNTPINPSRISALKTVLVALFALTTPLGITIGLLTLGGSRPDVDPATLLLTEGLLSAVSAGMLIYAACVEMLAADFVLDPALAKTPARRQVLAVLSLAAGAGGMSLVGFVDPFTRKAAEADSSFIFELVLGCRMFH